MSHSTAEKESPQSREELAAQDHLVGAELGQYSLESRIGEGASAVIYRAIHKRLRISYAVKILHPAIASRQGMRERFLNEAQAAAQLRHENIVQVVDFAIDPQVGPYMVMEYLEGQTLQTLLEKEVKLSPARVYHLCEQICRGFQEAHDRGIIHRDLKPENIFLVTRSKTETPKILDFGLARLIEGHAHLTGAGNIIGTPLYMSPEQCRGEVDLTVASDIYSFGVMLFQMLTGSTPFVGENPQKLIVDHFLVEPPKLGPEFPDSLRDFQDMLLSKKPEQRPSSMEDVWEKLSLYLQEAIQLQDPNATNISQSKPSLYAKPSTPPPHTSPHNQQLSKWEDDEPTSSNHLISGTKSTPPNPQSFADISQQSPRRTMGFEKELNVSKELFKTHAQSSTPLFDLSQLPNAQDYLQGSKPSPRPSRATPTHEFQEETHNTAGAGGSQNKPKDPLLRDLEEIFSSPEPKSPPSGRSPYDTNPELEAVSPNPSNASLQASFHPPQPAQRTNTPTSSKSWMEEADDEPVIELKNQKATTPKESKIDLFNHSENNKDHTTIELTAAPQLKADLHQTISDANALPALDSPEALALLEPENTGFELPSSLPSELVPKKDKDFLSLKPSSPPPPTPKRRRPSDPLRSTHLDPVLSLTNPVKPSGHHGPPIPPRPGIPPRRRPSGHNGRPAGPTAPKQPFSVYEPFEDERTTPKRSNPLSSITFIILFLLVIVGVGFFFMKWVYPTLNNKVDKPPKRHLKLPKRDPGNLKLPTPKVPPNSK